MFRSSATVRPAPFPRGDTDMSIVQYNPWGNARGLQDEIKQVFDRFLG